ncbi:MAG TPA: SRPBCC domain-containing protein [Polyangium sp.]|nr:SRPBCC domain-containing protein [Polyangium sp.]
MMDGSENSLAEQTIPPPHVTHRVTIDAPRMRVWEALTNIEQLRQWMAEPEIRMEVAADWKVGGSVVVKGFHHAAFENKGTVLEFDPPNFLRYSQLSSLSRLPQTPENHTEFEFRLTEESGQTVFELTMRGFPTDSIYRHLDFYWRVTLGILKQFIETSRP